MFKDFDTSSLKKMKPPGDNTFDTMQEIKSLAKIKMNKSFVKKFDNQEKAFKETAKRKGIKDYDSSIATINRWFSFFKQTYIKIFKHFFYFFLELLYLF